MANATTTRVPAVLAYLVTTFQAAATIGQATPPVNVIDGPNVTADPGNVALWVGCEDIDPATVMPVAARSTESRGNLSDMGGLTRNEAISVPCVIQAQSASDDVPSLRATAAAVMAAVDTLIRGDRTLGGNVILTTPGVNTAEWQQGPSTRGMAVRLLFTIDAEAQI